LQICFCATDGFYPIPFLRDRIYVDELAAASRAAYRIQSISPLQSRIGFHRSDYYTTSSISSSGLPIPADDEAFEIDTEDVECDQTDGQRMATSTSSLAKRLLDFMNIEGSLKHGVTSRLQQRPLFLLDKEIITAADATAFQLQAKSLE
jgi:hypothetical protein